MKNNPPFYSTVLSAILLISGNAYSYTQVQSPSEKPNTPPAKLQYSAKPLYAPKASKDYSIATSEEKSPSKVLCVFL